MASARAALLKHARKFGWEQVPETAAQMGVDLEAPKKETDREKATRLKKDRAWAMHEDGRTNAEIASALNIAASTVRTYLSDPSK